MPSKNMQTELDKPKIVRPIAATFVLGLIITGLATWAIHISNQDSARAAVAEAAERMARDVTARMELYQYGLSGVRGAVLTAGDAGINLELFLRYSATRDVDSEFPGARGFGFIRRVPRAAEERYVAQMRADGRPDFAIRELAPHDQERYVIQYIEPVGRNAAAVGLDIGSERHRRTAADAAMRSGKTQLTGPITLVQATGEPQQSFLLLMPIYRGAATPDTVEKRETAAFGWSYAPLLTREVLDPLDLDNDSFHFLLRDITEPGREETFYESTDRGSIASTFYNQVLEREVFGRQWQITFSAYPEFIQRLNQFQPATMFAIGLFATVLAAALAGALSINRQRKELATIYLEQQVAERTADLQTAKIAAESANAAKNRFLAVVSHEIRTPITGILGMADLMASSELRAEQQELLTRLTRSTHTLLDLINDILDFSKIESGRIEMDEADFSIRNTVSDLLAVMGPLASTKGNVIDTQIDKTVQSAYRGDAKKYRQILLNLLGNANKFTSSGKIKVSVRQVSSENGRLCVETLISDTGAGIEEKNQDHLFQPFVQEDSSTSRKYGGTGLGLTICKNFAEMMGGRIWFDSKKGEGSTFGFTVFLQPGDDAKVEANAGPQKRGPTAASQLTEAARPLQILVAEDNETTRMLMTAMLSRLGHTVHAVENGLEAVNAHKNERFDIVLMDMQMPVMDGPEAMEKIRAQEAAGPAIPMIALTADALEENHKNYIDAGADIVVTKPVNWQNLVAEMERLTQRVPISAA